MGHKKNKLHRKHVAFLEALSSVALEELDNDPVLLKQWFNVAIEVLDTCPEYPREAILPNDLYDFLYGKVQPLIYGEELYPPSLS